MSCFESRPQNLNVKCQCVQRLTFKDRASLLMQHLEQIRPLNLSAHFWFNVDNVAGQLPLYWLMESAELPLLYWKLCTSLLYSIKLSSACCLNFFLKVSNEIFYGDLPLPFIG